VLILQQLRVDRTELRQVFVRYSCGAFRCENAIQQIVDRAMPGQAM
jgi:hypothetical protein